MSDAQAGGCRLQSLYSAPTWTSARSPDCLRLRAILADDREQRKQRRRERGVPSGRMLRSRAGRSVHASQGKGRGRRGVQEPPPAQPRWMLRAGYQTTQMETRSPIPALAGRPACRRGDCPLPSQSSCGSRPPKSGVVFATCGPTAAVLPQRMLHGRERWAGLGAGGLFHRPT